MNKRGSAAGTALLIFLLVLLGVSLYFLYLNFPTEPIELTKSQNPQSEGFVQYSQSKQFYENMRYRDKRISYRIEDRCDEKKSSSVREAFDIIQEETVLEFYVSNTNPEITIFCSDIAPEAEREGYFVAGEGGPTEVINTTLYGVILSGKVSFFREEKCDKPNIALHEILHALGFDHNNNPDSIMYPTLDCDQALDESIIRDIDRLYSVASLPDFQISKVDATKGGRYLSFEIEVINRGLKEANDVSLQVLADGEFVKEFNLDKLPVGTTKILQVENLKVSRSAATITFVVDRENKIHEIFENNNQIVLEE